MKRCLLNSLVCLSILLWVAIATLWARGYWSWDSLYIAARWPALFQIRNLPLYFPRRTLLTTTRLTGIGIDLMNGSGFLNFTVCYTDDTFPHRKMPPPPLISLHRDHLKTAERTLFGPRGLNPRGLRFRRDGVSAEIDTAGVIHDLDVQYSCSASDWLLLLIFAVLPGWSLFGRVSKTRGKIGGCRSCGYDMRATPRRCPECGALAAGAIASDRGAS